MISIELILACAPAVAPETIQQIIYVESRGDPLAINVNKGHLERKPRDVADAVILAKSYIERGYIVDLGLMQINSMNVTRLGYRIEDMFEPCKNIAAGARILEEFYVLARLNYDNDQMALRAALSAYNTGNFRSGFTNGYVTQYNSGSLEIQIKNSYIADTLVFSNRKEITMNNPIKEIVMPVISESSGDADIPGVQIEYDAFTAEQNGMFEETAISEQEAWESNTDLITNIESTGIVIGE